MRKMSQNRQNCLKDFELISKLSVKLRKQVLKELSKDDKYYRALKEIARNTINKNIIPSDENKKKLKKFAEDIIEISSKTKDGPLKKQKLVVQSGVWIAYII